MYWYMSPGLIVLQQFVNVMYILTFGAGGKPLLRKNKNEAHFDRTGKKAEELFFLIGWPLPTWQVRLLRL